MEEWEAGNAESVAGGEKGGCGSGRELRDLDIVRFVLSTDHL